MKISAYISIVLSLAALGSASFSQSGAGRDDSTAAAAPKVYIDCGVCDFNYLKTEVTFTNFVRDRAEADVHVLVSTLQTAASGTEYTVEFRGQREFVGMTDTLKTVTLESYSEDAVRKALVRTLKAGLLRFVARTPLVNDVRISYDRPALKTDKIDKWKGWIFSINTNVYVEGEKSRRKLNLSGNLQASRVTAMDRFTIYIYGNYEEIRYIYDQYDIMSISRSRGSEVSLLFGLDDHWSLGGGTEVWMSSYSNYESVWEIYPALEYNIFPYSQSTRRQFRLQYVAALRYNDYAMATIYDKWSEWLGVQRLTVNLEFIQPWGSMEIWASASQYLPETSNNRIQFGTNLSLKIVKGLSVTLNGNYSAIHDQLNLARGNATQEELLLQRRQLATSYQYYGSIGIRYSFGSIYSTVVNPRFGGD